MAGFVFAPVVVAFVVAAAEEATGLEPVHGERHAKRACCPRAGVSRAQQSGRAGDGHLLAQGPRPLFVFVGGGLRHWRYWSARTRIGCVRSKLSTRPRCSRCAWRSHWWWACRCAWRWRTKCRWRRRCRSRWRDAAWWRVKWRRRRLGRCTRNECAGYQCRRSEESEDVMSALRCAIPKLWHLVSKPQVAGLQK